MSSHGRHISHRPKDAVEKAKDRTLRSVAEQRRVGCQRCHRADLKDGRRSSRYGACVAVEVAVKGMDGLASAEETREGIGGRESERSREIGRGRAEHI